MTNQPPETSETSHETGDETGGEAGLAVVDGLTVGGAREEQWPREWMGPFLRALRTMPNVTSACRVANISRTAAYEVKAEDEVFRAAWEDALEQSYDALEVFTHRMASTGLEVTETRRTVKRQLMPVLHEDGSVDQAQPPRLVVVEETEVTITNRMLSPQVAMFLLRAYRPKKYMPPPQRHEVGGSDGGPVQHEIYRALHPARALELARMTVELEAGPPGEHPDVEGVARNGSDG